MSNETEFKGQALNYVIIVKELAVKNETASGFDITSEVDKNDKQKVGIVMSVGNLCPKLDDGSNTVNIGDSVMYDKYKASSLTIDGVAYKCVYYADLVMLM